MIPRRPRPLCAICADRIANTITDWECESGTTRTIVACFPCLSPVKDPPEEFEPVDLAERVATRPAATGGKSCPDRTMRAAIVAEVEKRGEVTSKELQQRFALSSYKERQALTVALSRLVRYGILDAEWVDATDRNAGRRFRRAAASADPILAELARLPHEFSACDVGVGSGAIARWHGLGLIENVAPKMWKSPAVWRKTLRAIRSAA